MHACMHNDQVAKRSMHAGLALYQESESIALYTAFVLGVTVCGGYFLHANFWFLDIVIGGVPLQVVLIAVGTAFVPSLMLPVLVRSSGQPRHATAEPPQGQVWLNMMLIQQANLMLVMEELLFVGCVLFSLSFLELSIEGVPTRGCCPDAEVGYL